MKKIKIIISLFTTFVIICSCTQVFAYDNNLGDQNYLEYSGIATLNDSHTINCTFSISKILGEKFVGFFTASNIGYDIEDIATPIQGNVYEGANGKSLTCEFVITFNENVYFSYIILIINLEMGTCIGVASGSYHDSVEIIMEGDSVSYPIYEPIIGYDCFDEADFEICANLSDLVYEKNSKDLINSINDLFNSDNSNTNLSNSKIVFCGDDNKDKDSIKMILIERKNSINDIDLFCVLRGTDFLTSEMKGNIEITGTSYNAEWLYHKNFKTAEESIKSDIYSCYTKLADANPDANINLIITGHSRGAAVANIYAKEATDRIIGIRGTDIPLFSSVVAYTFATPNVQKHNSTMENYDNIFNFCFIEDLVPTVPLTNPTPGWDYWKYGKTFFGSANVLNGVNVSSDMVNDFQNALLYWNSIEKYYTQNVTDSNSNISLYDILDGFTNTLYLRGFSRFNGLGTSISGITNLNIETKNLYHYLRNIVLILGMHIIKKNIKAPR